MFNSLKAYLTANFMKGTMPLGVHLAILGAGALVLVAIIALFTLIAMLPAWFAILLLMVCMIGMLAYAIGMMIFAMFFY
jgi:hypothetical protein